MHRFHALLVCLIVGGCGGVPVDTAGTSMAWTEPGDFTGPAWSPDGSRISFSGPGFQGLYEVALDDGAIREIVPPGTRTWYRHGWRDGCIVRPRLGENNALELTPGDGVIRVVAPNPLEPAIELRDDDLVWVGGGQERWLTHGEDRFFDPVMSPDGTLVAFVGLATGVHVIELDSGLAVAHGGAGTHPTWTPDGTTVVFERVLDDGHDLVAGDLYALDLGEGAEARQLTGTVAIERYPAVSPDGTRLAYVRDGAVWVSGLGEEVPR